jgi:hypothetical protein
MEKQPTFNEDQDLPSGEPGDLWHTDNVHYLILAQTPVASEQRRRDAHEQAAMAAEEELLVLTSKSSPSGIPDQRDPGQEEPGIFFDSYELTLPGGLQAPEALGRQAGTSEKETDQFHKSESEDIYDLYNACNGAIRGGLLDISKLDELTPEELEALNVDRLRDIWLHTASGCSKCETIIATLNMVRGLAVDEGEEVFIDQVQLLNVSDRNSIF